MALMTVAADAIAEPLQFQPRLSTGVQDYKLTFDDAINANGTGYSYRDGFKVQDRLSFAGVGLTATSGRLFMDISGQWSGKGHDQTTQYEGTFAGIGNFGNGHNHLLVGTFDRQELNATVGWGLTPELSAYLGYKHSKLDLSQQMSPLTSPPPDFQDVLFFGTRRIDFSYQGLFIGATYSLPVGHYGALSLQSSIAQLNATFTEHFSGNVALCAIPQAAGCVVLGIDPSFADKKPSVHGESVGFNLGLSWTGNFAWLTERLQKLSYTVGIDRSQYAFDSGNQSDASLAANFTEINTRARLDLRYRFGQ